MYFPKSIEKHCYTSLALTRKQKKRGSVMNKKIAIILALALSASMACAGCSGNKPEETTTGTTAAVTEASTTETSKEETSVTAESSDSDTSVESSEAKENKEDTDSSDVEPSADAPEEDKDKDKSQDQDKDDGPIVVNDPSSDDNGPKTVDSGDKGDEDPVVVIDTPDEDNGSKDSSDENYYSAVTAMGKADVEKFCAMIREAYVKSDWETISKYLRYPANVNNEELKDADAFMKYIDGKKPAADDLKEMEDETCKDIFFNGKGICLGSGQVWIIDENYLTDKTPNLQIFSMFGV